MRSSFWLALGSLFARFNKGSKAKSMKGLKAEMLTMSDYMKMRGIAEEDMREAEERIQAYIDAYNRREACKKRHMAQAQAAEDSVCEDRDV